MRPPPLSTVPNLADVTAELAGGVRLFDVSDLLPGRPYMRMIRKRTDLVVLHHTGADAPSVDGWRAVSATAGFHTGAKGWRAIGYHVYVNRRADRDMTGAMAVYQTLPLDREGAGARGLNRRAIHVVLEGNLDAQKLTHDQEEALEALFPWLDQRFPGADYIGHREAVRFGGLPVFKSCPGERGMAWLRDWRRP